MTPWGFKMPFGPNRNLLNFRALVVAVPMVLCYRVTGKVYITVIIFPGINFGITLHSLYRKHF